MMFSSHQLVDNGKKVALSIGSQYISQFAHEAPLFLDRPDEGAPLEVLASP